MCKKSLQEFNKESNQELNKKSSIDWNEELNKNRINNHIKN